MEGHSYCLHLFNGIFALERKVSVFDRDYRETIAEIRRRWSAPLFECLTGFLEELAKTVCVRRRTGARASADKSELGAGVAYCLNNIKELREFLTNPDLCISNAISELNIAETARARCTKKILRTVDAAYCYGVLETLALSCRRNGVDFTTWLLWAYTEMAKRYSVSHGGQPLRRPVPYKVPLESLTEKQRLEMGGRRIYMENGVPHVKLHLFDSAYRHHVDELDISGLSITDFKRKCLKDIAPSGDQELILSLYMAEKAKRQGR